MSEDTNVPAQQDTGDVAATAANNSPEQQTTVPVSNDGITDWKKRYDGQQIALQKLSIEKQELQKQLGEKTSQLEQLDAQLSLKETEKSVAVGERDKQLQEALQRTQELESELRELKALKLKVEVANELGKPELIAVADAFPNLDDKELLTQVMKDISGFTDKQVKAREDQLLAGTLPSINQADTTPSVPQTEAEWVEHLNSLPFGSPEKQKALDQYGDFLNSKYQNQ